MILIETSASGNKNIGDIFRFVASKLGDEKVGSRSPHRFMSLSTVIRSQQVVIEIIMQIKTNELRADK